MDPELKRQLLRMTKWQNQTVRRVAKEVLQEFQKMEKK